MARVIVGPRIIRQLFSLSTSISLKLIFFSFYCSGYMSLEYAIDGLFSIKSDVYSFGVLLLEIVSGEKIRSFHHPDHNLNLLGIAWKLYEEGKFLELIDGVIAESCNQSELLRAIQIGLLCVQPYARDRPSMSFVVAMPCSELSCLNRNNLVFSLRGRFMNQNLH